MISAKENEDFPYRMNTICYFKVYSNGKVCQVRHKNKCDLPGVKE